MIPDDIDPNDLVQSQVSVNFDRTHYQRDMNVVLPIDRLHELRDAGEIGGVSPIHFSVQGASPTPGPSKPPPPTWPTGCANSASTPPCSPPFDRPAPPPSV